MREIDPPEYLHEDWRDKTEVAYRDRPSLPLKIISSTFFIVFFIAILFYSNKISTYIYSILTITEESLFLSVDTYITIISCFLIASSFIIKYKMYTGISDYVIDNERIYLIRLYKRNLLAAIIYIIFEGHINRSAVYAFKVLYFDKISNIKLDKNSIKLCSNEKDTIEINSIDNPERVKDIINNHSDTSW
jgi:hypothetical protein